MKDIHILWYICIVVRFLFAFFIEKLPFSNVICFVIGIGFLWKFITGSNDEYQIAKVFWHNTRIIHSLFFLSAIYKKKILFLDILFSIIYRTSMI